MFEKYLVELFGTFVFLSSILFLVKNNISLAPYLIGLTLTLVILAGGSISGGHFNPAVSFMFFLNNKLSSTDLIGYCISQLLGGLLAHLVIIKLLN
tara:strand:+ start:96 stop:383 length:288 start_codon:yes stop_codon:yes gene_type:complete